MNTAYSLLLVFTMFASDEDGSHLEKQFVPDVGNYKQCQEAGKQAIADLEHTVKMPRRYSEAAAAYVTVKFTCIPSGKMK